jgi:hypothetical protein
MQDSPRTRQRYRRGFFAFLYGVGALLLVVLLTAEVTSHPRFCGSHHYIRPYYESWQRSTHKDVSCHDCHFPVGLRGEIERKWRALAEVAIFVTRSYRGEPRAEVHDDGCLRPGCHIDQHIPGVAEYKGAEFDHRKHLPCGEHHLSGQQTELAQMPTEMPPRARRRPPPGHTELIKNLPRQRVLRCTSCHSQLVQGNHMTVTESTCFLCHFKGMPKKEPISGCPSCHQAPSHPILVAGMEFRHQPYVEQGVTCGQCHVSVVEGDGSVPKERCYLCHDRPERLQKFDDHFLVHWVHVTEHTIDCLVCHTEIRHQKQTMSETIASECQKCHESTEAIYMGLSTGVDPAPDAMFLARVSCLACHRSHEDQEATHLRDVTKPEACVVCHGPSFAHMQPQWNEAGQRLLAALNPKVEQIGDEIQTARRSRRVRPEDLEAADVLYRIAVRNVETLRTGNPIHNVRFSQKLAAVSSAQLAMAAQMVNGSVPAAAVPRPKEPQGGRCSTCHFGIEIVSTAYEGTPFPHEPHVLQAGLSCEQCHSSQPLEQEGHGRTHVRRTDCQTCHHDTRTKAACETCHTDMATRVVSYSKPFNHAYHARNYGLACAACHAADTTARFRADCSSCHHTEPVAFEQRCTACHATQAAVYRGALEGRPTRASIHSARDVACTQCHSAQQGRMTTVSCATCHEKGNYPGIQKAWQSRTDSQLRQIAAERSRLSARGGAGTLPAELRDAIAGAERNLRTFSEDGSRGVHHPELTDTTLHDDLEQWRRAAAAAAPRRGR